jgi:hypothetical protein
MITLSILSVALFACGWCLAVAVMHEMTEHRGYPVYLASLLWPFVVLFVLLQAIYDWLKHLYARRYA